MALHLIIDGYNLIRQSRELREFEAQDLAWGRQALLARLAEYRLSRPGHQVTVVFDGRVAGGMQECRDRQQGLGIVYSRRGETADEVIKRLLAKERARAVVVTSDRELQYFAERTGAAWIGALSFEMSHLQGRDPAPPDEADPDTPYPAAKKGPAHRLPKRQRRRQQRLRKL
jgi:predicted RNA-binding protein with PIN domain